jgi:hypothetical protein
MDVNALPISPEDPYARFGTAKAPLLIDVRRREAFGSDQFANQRRGACRMMLPFHHRTGGAIVLADG